MVLYNDCLSSNPTEINVQLFHTKIYVNYFNKNQESRKTI